MRTLNSISSAIKPAWVMSSLGVGLSTRPRGPMRIDPMSHGAEKKRPHARARVMSTTEPRMAPMATKPPRLKDSPANTTPRSTATIGLTYA
ncbi:hypothetical protein CYFUS_009310 [Cystobacter fuscus]|uniref:Uncharacterized protein n=1 Tax=Cystobacter fuscus TaxID=43 RepID=A0A250JJL9_9BACT|nr:hypothetical protein CYFUS_009310 [Cystobacter fuscus]